MERPGFVSKKYLIDQTNDLKCPHIVITFQNFFQYI